MHKLTTTVKKEENHHYCLLRLINYRWFKASLTFTQANLRTVCNKFSKTLQPKKKVLKVNFEKVQKRVILLSI